MTDHQDTHTAPLPTPAAGPRLTVQAPLELLQLHMPQVQHIYTEKQNQQEATHA